MKKIFILVLLTSFAGTAQSNFKVENGQLVWEKTFSAVNPDIVAVLEREPNLKVSSFMDNVYKGSCNDWKGDCDSGSGLMKNNCKFDFLIIVNPDGYTVKVKNVKILEKYGPMQARTIANPCEKYFVEGNSIRNSDKYNP
ncbi:hypothetical protein, partial [Flavobacterium sp.]|uniref:hypothetical protein n=1 Tax=Flavobacterium sp. TaxID=239 RepID=UPI0026082C49